MTKIRIVGNALVVTSEINKADLDKVKIAAPEALVLREAVTDGSIRELFRIDNGPSGSFNSNGISFNGVSEEGFLRVTVLLPADVKDKTAYVKTNFLKVFDRLEALTTQITEVSTAVSARTDEIFADLACE